MSAPPSDDPDGDGVRGTQDHCPEQPEDCDCVQDEDGCPDPDNDGDGIVDMCDACPQERGEQPDGCVHRVVIQNDVLRILRGIFFGANATAIASAHAPIVDEIARVMQTHPEIIRVIVRGYADRGERNVQALSQRRAEVVVARLVALGVEPARLTAEGVGDTRPSSPATTREGRAMNRRIQFEVAEHRDPPPPPPPRSLPAGCPDHPPAPTAQHCSARCESPSLTP